MTPDEMKADMLATFAEEMAHLQAMFAARHALETEFRWRQAAPEVTVAEQEALPAMAERLHEQKAGCDARLVSLWEEMMAWMDFQYSPEGYETLDDFEGHQQMRWGYWIRDRLHELRPHLPETPEPPVRSDLRG